MDTDTPPPHCHFDKSGAAKSHASNDRNAALPCRHFDRSEAAKSLSPMAGSIAEGDLSAQRFNKLQSLCPHIGRSPAQDKDVDEQHPVIFRGIN